MSSYDQSELRSAADRMARTQRQTNYELERVQAQLRQLTAAQDTHTARQQEVENLRESVWQAGEAIAGAAPLLDTFPQGALLVALQKRRLLIDGAPRERLPEFADKAVATRAAEACRNLESAARAALATSDGDASGRTAAMVERFAWLEQARPWLRSYVTWSDLSHRVGRSRYGYGTPLKCLLAFFVVLFVGSPLHLPGVVGLASVLGFVGTWGLIVQFVRNLRSDPAVQEEARAFARQMNLPKLRGAVGDSTDPGNQFVMYAARDWSEKGAQRVGLTVGGTRPLEDVRRELAELDAEFEQLGRTTGITGMRMFEALVNRPGFSGGSFT